MSRCLEIRLQTLKLQCRYRDLKINRILDWFSFSALACFLSMWFLFLSSLHVFSLRKVTVELDVSICACVVQIFQELYLVC